MQAGSGRLGLVTPSAMHAATATAAAAAAATAATLISAHGGNELRPKLLLLLGHT